MAKEDPRAGKDFDRAVIAVTSNLDAVWEALEQIRTLNNKAFQEIARVAMTRNATFQYQPAVDLLVGHSVLGQTLYDKHNNTVADRFKHVIAGLLEREGNKWVLVKPVLAGAEIIDSDPPYAAPN